MNLEKKQKAEKFGIELMLSDELEEISSAREEGEDVYPLCRNYLDTFSLAKKMNLFSDEEMSRFEKDYNHRMGIKLNYETTA